MRQISIFFCCLWSLTGFTQSYSLTVEAGYGGGSFEAGDTVFVYARIGATTEAFTGWGYRSNSDVTFLSDRNEWWVAFQMPANDLTFTAHFTTIPDNVLTFETIQGAEELKPVYWAYPSAARGTIFFFHGTGGSAQGWVQPNRDQRFAMVKEVYAAGYGVVITESEESTLRQDLNGDGKIRWQAYPIDTLTNIDYRNMKAILDTFEQRSLLDRANLYSIGMSNGGSFSGTFSLAFRTQASVVYCAGSQPSVARNTDAAVLFCLMPNDATIGVEGNTDAYTHQQHITDRGGCSEVFMNSRMPLYPELFTRIGLSEAVSREIFEEIRRNGLLDETNYPLFSVADFQEQVQTTPTAFPILVSQPNRTLIDIANLYNLADGGHVFYANHNRQTLDFMSERCQLTRNINAPSSSLTSLHVYPNPSPSNEVQILDVPAGEYFYQTYNTLGQMVAQGNLPATGTLPLPAQPGHYWVYLRGAYNDFMISLKKL